MVELGKELVEGDLRRLQLVVGLELRGQGGLHDVIEEEVELLGKSRVGWQEGTLALEGSDGVADVVADLRQLAQHERIVIIKLVDP
jgi:hypothetical protein